jgi:hypothetical protein
VSPAIEPRRGDRIVVKTTAGEVLVKELARATARTLELLSVIGRDGDRTLDRGEVAWVARVLWASQYAHLGGPALVLRQAQDEGYCSDGSVENLILSLSKDAVCARRRVSDWPLARPGGRPASHGSRRGSPGGIRPG